MKKRVFSGIQPTGDIHIGNYLGAMQHWAASQAEFDNIFCIVDLHSITVPQDAKLLRAKTRELAGLLLAVGIDPELSSIFVQSQIHEHAELTWILNCFTPLGWLQRMTQYKEKAARQEIIGAGLLDYPVLMAADILLYEADYVPVGEDQKQHVELTRDIANRFNSIYGQVLKVPEPVIAKTGARIMGLAINLLDPPKTIIKKIKRSTTDSQRDILFDEKRPGIYNLLTIYEIISGISKQKIESHFKGKGYGDLKLELADLIIDKLKPIQDKYRDVTSDSAYIDKVLSNGAEKVRSIAARVLGKVKKKVGLG